jgi:hypothetical protein
VIVAMIVPTLHSQRLEEVVHDVIPSCVNLS